MAVEGTITVATPPIPESAQSTTPRNAQQKRAATEKASNDRAAKRRSSRACLSCRTRKVRCDAVTGGSPCTNCRLDNVECILIESCRGRKPSEAAGLRTRPVASPPAFRSAVTRTQQATPPHNEQANDYMVCLTFEDQHSESQSGDGGEEDDGHESRGGFGMDDDIIGHQDTLQDSLPHFDVSLEPVTTHLNSPPRTHTNHGRRRQNDATSNNTSHEHGPVTPLPIYIKQLPHHLAQRDIDYLFAKDAFTIPDDEFRDELLKTYVKIVHIFMPAIDLDKLITPVIKADGQDPISVLLFQAVMFAAVIFVDSDMLQIRGFSSRKAARKIFFNRVRLLYALDCEPDRLTLIQALLLMTYWYDSPEDEKDTWYWMGITLSLSQVLGLHRDPETLHIRPQEKRLRRRIWWSCYIRDRLLALGIRRPARIRAEDYNVSMLEIDDYDTTQPTPEHIAFVRSCGFATPEADRRKLMCQICIELAKLCICIGDILHSQYSVVSFRAYSSEHYKNVAVLPKQSEQQLSELSKCDARLEEWQRNQETACWYTPPSPSSTTASISNQREDWADKVTWLHQALLRMIYLTAVGALHRPRALDSSHRSIAGPEVEQAIPRQTSMRKVKEAATALTRLAFDLQSENYLRYLSTSSIPAFLSATLIHLLDVCDTKEEVRSLAIGRFYQCFHVLFELKDMYSSADYAIRFLTSVLRRMNTNIPMLAMLSVCESTMTEKQGRHVAVTNVHEGGPDVPPYKNFAIRPVDQCQGESQGQRNRGIGSVIPSQHKQFAGTAALAYAPRAASGPQARQTDTVHPTVESRFPSVNLDFSSSDTSDLLSSTDPGAPLQPLSDAFLSNTLDIQAWDGLLPALIDFEADPFIGASTLDFMTPGGSWRPCGLQT